MSEETKRLIERPWFRASTRATSMMFIMHITESSRRLAPLSGGEQELGWFVLPPFQRPSVWSREQQIRFIESAWMGLPLGVIVYNRPEDVHSRYDNWLLDGQQRVTAVLDYVNDKFPVYGYLFSELTDVDRRFWGSVSFASMETNLDDENKLRDIYDRLAYGGTPHKAKADQITLGEIYEKGVRWAER